MSRKQQNRRRSPTAHSRTSSDIGISQILQRWRRQVAARSDLAERRGVRPFALVGYRTRAAPAEPLIPLERLSFVALFDERDDEDRLLTRLVGARARLVDGTLVVGGPDNTLFDKDLRSAPCSADGRRLDPRDAELSELALGWEQHLERVNRHPHYPRRNVLRWPAWWCEVDRAPPDCPTHLIANRTLIPLETATACGLSIGHVYADVTGLPKRQVLAGADVRRLLCGTAGAVSFDLFHTQFHRAR
ncbi:MAG: hypothetical protein JNL96_06770 [Planctomycetaceae bacterium]|nr:hypothetical protein [Planctomycetaceae bacterium]